MTLEQRISALSHLRNLLTEPDQGLRELISNAHINNPWFSPEEVARSINGIVEMLNPDDLRAWIPKISGVESKKVGLILAGNIPLVGFHDILSVLVSGHIAIIKLSSQDRQLIPYLFNYLISVEPAFAEQIQFVERLEAFDAVIATGSTNTSRYFEYYFGKVPNIIRKNRNSIALLNGTETSDDLSKLGHDIFAFYGLGCRNVSKLYVPRGYDFTHFFESIEKFNKIINHNKYCNNYEYNKSIYLINRDKHLDNGFLLLKQDNGMSSPLAVLFYEEYTENSELADRLIPRKNEIQCVVSGFEVNSAIQTLDFGGSQLPKLWDYADGINTLEFLGSL